MVGINCCQSFSEGACKSIHVSLDAWVTRFEDNIVYMYAGIFRYLCEAKGIVHVASVFLLLCARAY